MSSLLTPKQAALAIGVSESSMRRWCDQGRIPVERTAGGHRRIELGTLMLFARQNGIELTPAAASRARGRGGRQADEAILVERTYQWLILGDELALRGLIFDVVGHGDSLAFVCDRLLAPALDRIGHQWGDGALDVYQEHRATQIVLELLTSARELTRTPRGSAPVALCGALRHDIYSVATAMSALVLRECGWKSVNLGPDTPGASLRKAIDDLRPALVALSVSCVTDAGDMLENYRALHGHAAKKQTAVAVGGQALTQEIRRAMVADFFGDTMAHLAAYATGLRQHLAGNTVQDKEIEHGGEA